MTITKLLALVFSVFFMFILVAPTLVLLNSNEELSCLVMSLEEETEKKEIEDVKELTEVTFNDNSHHNAYLSITTKSLSFLFFTRAHGEIHLENTSPPPKFL
jgi:hypothetical protein